MKHFFPQKIKNSFSASFVHFFLVTFALLSLLAVNAQGPQLNWAKQLGGVNNESGSSIAVDASGNVYTTGNFAGTVDFDPGSGTFNLTSEGETDIFISKLDASGNFLWAKQMGGTDDEGGTAIAIDASGNIYTTGYFFATADFDPGSGTFNLTSAGGTDIFISKLDASGNFIWAKRMGGAVEPITNLPVIFDGGFSIAIDASGNVYTTGRYRGTADFDPGAGTYNLTSVSADNDNEIFISKLTSAGSFVWAKGIGGNDPDGGHSIVIDGAGNVYTTGWFRETVDFDPGSATFNLSSIGFADIFISKLDTSGNFVWAKQLGGIEVDYGGSIALDNMGNIYTTGWFTLTADFDPGSGTANLTAALDAVFICKLDNSGNFIWAKKIEGNDYYDYCNSIAIDASGNVYTAGYFGGTADFDPGPDTFNLSSTGVGDIFISKLDTSGNFVWAKKITGSDDDFVFSMAVDAGNVYTTGYFSGTTDFDTGSGTLNLTSAGERDIFIHSMSQTLGINEVSENHQILVYPNPASKKINLQFPKVQNGKLTVYNLSGKAIYAKQFNNNNIQIPVFNLAEGLYFLQIKSNKNIVNKKIMVKR